MKPITPIIPGRDLPVTTYAKDQPEYLQLPVHREADGLLTSRWRLSWRERLRIALTGDLWLQVMTFNHRLQPVKLSVTAPEIQL